MARVLRVVDDGRRFYERLLEENGVLVARGRARFAGGALSVSDEDGDFVGLATLEDVIEELVGEIRDAAHLDE